MTHDAPPLAMTLGEGRPSRLSWWLRRRCARQGIVLSGTRFCAGQPLPRLKNEAGNMHLGAVTISAGVRLWSHKGGKLAVADEAVLDQGVEVIAWEQVTIGRACYLGWDALIMDTDLHTVGDQPILNRPVIIGDHVHVGCRAMILKGVTIGDNAHIEPGAIVTHDVPPGGIARPVMARNLASQESHEHETRS